ncbi:MAG: hypothetical protein B7Y45_06780 [Sphingomonas sp. 28-66-16]|nr:MAG: hypothetical protein B7Y45_06780 [Sphingomonas sp. 28-66-16]
MIMRLTIPAALALLAGATAASGQSVTIAAKLPCLAPPEAESLVASIVPELVADVGRICAKSLPPTALVRQSSGPFIDRYRAEADRAWPRAQALVTRIAGADATGLLGSAFARPLLATLITPTITRSIDPADCATIERIVSLAQPLPSRNAAALFVAIVQLADSKRRDAPGKFVLPLCRQEGR